MTLDALIPNIEAPIPIYVHPNTKCILVRDQYYMPCPKIKCTPSPNIVFDLSLSLIIITIIGICKDNLIYPLYDHSLKYVYN